MKAAYFILAVLLCTVHQVNCAPLSELNSQNQPAVNLTAALPSSTEHGTAKLASTTSLDTTNFSVDLQGAPTFAINLTNFQNSEMAMTVGNFFSRPVRSRHEGSSPEPGTVFLLGAGLAGVIFVARQKFRK